MKYRMRKSPSSPPITRAGATLSEVLISLLVMSIGVVSLATLFPISVLRSIQATQLTNATNLRYNVEALINALPQVYTVGTQWQPSTGYAANAVVTPTNYASLKYPPLVAINQTGAAQTSGITEPAWMNTALDGTGGTTFNWTVFLLQNYIVDPQGEYIATYDDPNGMARGPAAGAHFFGNNPGSISTYTTTSSIRSFAGLNFQSTSAGLPSSYDDYQAANLATLPDSWTNQAESTSVAYTAGTNACTLTLNDPRTDLTVTTLAPSINGTATSVPAAFAPSRIIFFDVTGKVSHARPIYDISGAPPSQTITWSAGNLPATFFPVSARVETLDRRYTWMLSVRRGFSGTASMDVVVFFRRRYSGKDEQIYPATFQTGAVDPANSNAAGGVYSYYSSDPGYDAAPGISGVDDDNNGTIDDITELGYPGSDDQPRNWVVIQYATSGDKPFYKKGGFVCDANNLRWYRITDVVEGDIINGYTPAAVMTKGRIPTSATNMSTYQPDTLIAGCNAVLLKLEKPIDQSGFIPSGGVAGGGTPNGGAIMMRGIVEIYPIRAQLSWEN